MLHDVGFSSGAAKGACLAAGAIEMIAGLVILLVWKWRWPLWVTLGLMPAMAVCVAIASPRMIVGAFNPIALNAAVFALAAVFTPGRLDLAEARLKFSTSGLENVKKVIDVRPRVMLPFVPPLSSVTPASPATP